MVSHLFDRQQALQARVHVAEERVILKADNSIFVLGQTRWQLCTGFLVRDQCHFNLLVLGIVHDGGSSPVHPNKEAEQVLTDVVKLCLVRRHVHFPIVTHLVDQALVVYWSR